MTSDASDGKGPSREIPAGLRPADFSAPSGALARAGSAEAGADGRTGRFFLVLWGITAGAQLAGLQLRQAVFGGTAWLSSIKYETWAERLGLISILLVLSLAAAGTWLLAWIGVLRCFRVGRARALSIATGTWVALLAADFLVRQRVHALVGDAWRFVDAAYDVGGTRAVLRNVRDWYGDLILKGAVVCLVLGAAAYGLARFLRNPRRSWGWIDRLTLRALVPSVLGADALLVLFLSLGGRWWPDTRELVAAETLPGPPLSRLISMVPALDGARRGPLGEGLSLDDLEPDRKAAIDALSDYPPVRFSEKKNVVLILLESVRWDSLATTIRGRPVMPCVGGLIEHGAVASPYAYASNGFTHPSLRNLSWGGFFPPGTTLLDDFRSNGYEIAAFSGYDMKEEGFEEILGFRGDDRIVDARRLEVTLPRRTAPARRVVEPLVRWLAERPRGRPFFTFVYFDDAHFPYLQDNPPVLSDGPLPVGKIRADNREELRRAYYNQVYHVDRAIGRVMQGLADAGGAEETIVVIMSDHGESLFDDGSLIGHGLRLNEVMTHSILVVMNAPRNVPSLMSHCHVRGLLREFLTLPGTAAPRAIPVPGRRVMQFLGSVTSPTQIAEISLEEGRLGYDVRRDLVWDERSGKRGTFAEERLGPDLYRRARGLILDWKYLLNIPRR